ncbi:MAG: hypothetical protein IPL84_18085 [Chitinophagaceae bacterium]|nr:hypothetical protein [Chitinophagaceae bacterium]
MRWNAYGDESNTFTIDYFDGTSWNLIDNNVPATAQSYNWVLPATVSNNYLIRVRMHRHIPIKVTGILP